MGALNARGIQMVNLVTEGVAADIIEVLKGQGLPVTTSMDIDVPSFPKDVTLIDDKEMMELSTKYTANYNFLLTQVTCAEIAVTELDEKISYLEAKLLVEKTESHPKATATIIKASIAVNPDIRTLLDTLLKAKAYHKLLKTMQDNVDRYSKLLSRELTRRTSGLKSSGF